MSKAPYMKIHIVINPASGKDEAVVVPGAEKT